MNLLMDTQASACFCVTQNTPTTWDLAWTATGRNVPSELENNPAGHSFVNRVCEKYSRDGFINLFFLASHILWSETTAVLRCFVTRDHPGRQPLTVHHMKIKPHTTVHILQNSFTPFSPHTHYLLELQGGMWPARDARWHTG